MNTPNKLTLLRILLTLVIIFLLLFPFESIGLKMPELFVNASLTINIKYLIAGVIFIIASLTDFLDGYIARKYNLVTDFGKLVDAIADKVLVNSVLIILAAQGFISPIIPVVIIFRDCVVDAIKMLAASKGTVVAAIKSGKLKTACMMVGIVLTLFYNMPFELVNLRVADVLLMLATILSIWSGIQYFTMNKKLIFENGI